MHLEVLVGQAPHRYTANQAPPLTTVCVYKYEFSFYASKFQFLKP